MEQYGLDALAASAEAVVPGLGPLAVALAGLAGAASGAGTLDAMELLVTGPRGRGLLCGVVQLGLDAQAAAEVRVPVVTGADGAARRRAEPGHARRIVTAVGEVRVTRIGYRAGKKGVPALFPRDGVLNLPPRRYSWQLQRLAVMFARDGAYALAREFVLAATGVTIGVRQLEEMVAAAAADVDGFYAGPADGALPDAAGPLGLSADGKGVAMLPQSRRKRTRAPEQRVRTFATRPGIGEKGHKRIAEVACVFDVIPESRTPEQVMASHHGGDDQAPAAAAAAAAATTKKKKKKGKPAPEAVNRRYRVDITADRAEAIGWLFDEAIGRDPGQDRDWIALVDGDNHQIARIEAEAEDRGLTCPVILIDLIHVLEYLWKAAWALHAPRDPAIETWTITAALDILHGRAAAVITRIARLARQHPPQGPEHAKNIKKALSYLQAKQPYLDYPKALAAGWPIATGVIEGACRHLVKDRMAITGARWSTQGAQAILHLRVIHANGDHDTYWTHHITQEHQRNHLSHYQHGLDLAA